MGRQDSSFFEEIPVFLLVLYLTRNYINAMIVSVLVPAAGWALESMEFWSIIERFIQAEKEIDIVFRYLFIAFIAVNINIIPSFDISTPCLWDVVNMLLWTSYTLSTGSKIAVFATLVHFYDLGFCIAHITFLLFFRVRVIIVFAELMTILACYSLSIPFTGKLLARIIYMTMLMIMLFFPLQLIEDIDSNDQKFKRSIFVDFGQEWNMRFLLILSVKQSFVEE